MEMNEGIVGGKIMFEGDDASEVNLACIIDGEPVGIHAKVISQEIYPFDDGNIEIRTVFSIIEVAETEGA